MLGLMRTSPRAKGGALSRDRVVRNLVSFLRERSDTYVTTFFDLYGLPADFPGREEAAVQRNPLIRSELIERSLHSVVVRQARCRTDRFLPHIQPHEFEALLFADPSAFGRYKPDWELRATSLAAVVASVPSPEHLNDGPNTHPSARLEDALHGYRKVSDGVNVAAIVGVERMRMACQHFSRWFGRMANLQPLSKRG